MVGANPLLSGVLAISCCYSLYLAVAQTTNPTEVNALRAIRKSLVDPMGNLHTWNSGDPCTSYWLGIACNSSANDHYLHVQELFLLNLNLSGCLAPELGLLSHLKILLLSGNQLSGSLPTVLGYLPNLKRLQIDQNQMSASIPKSFASLNRVVHLHMNNNSLSGQIPQELSRLKCLLHLLLDNNNLSGLLPSELSKLPSLQILVTLIQSISEPICYQTRAMFIAWELFSWSY